MARTVNLTGDNSLNQGSRFQYVIDVLNLNLTGYSARMQVRLDKDPSSTLLLDASAYCTVDPIDGQVVIDMPGSATVDATWSAAYYDVLITNADPTKNQRILQGRITLDRQVTV